MVNKSLLELRNLTKVFKVGGGLGLLGGRTIRAVDDISFAIPGDKANITALVGESGSGKTTIARLILGLTKPTSGQILYKGADIYSLLKKNPRSYRREVQVIFQDPYGVYNPFYRVERVLEILVKKFNIASEDKDARSIVLDALKAIGLRPEDVIGRYPHQLSGGERQRLMLARILLMKPKLLIADEPVSMIDVSLRAMFLDSLMEFKKKLGISCLYVTHDLNIAHYVADNMVVLCYGRAVEKGETRSVVREPLHPYTRLLVSAIPNPDPKKRWKDKLDVEVTALKELRVEHGCIFHSRCPHAMPICKQKRPPSVSVKSGREVACFLYQEKA